MTRQAAKPILEAILFTMGDSVEIERLAAVIEADADATREILLEMQEEYVDEGRGLALLELDGAFQMCTRGDMYEHLIKIAKIPRKLILTDTLLETLSIVAYKQPVTKSDIESIRGVSCDHAVNRLMELELVAEQGRLDAPGRPLLFGTTEAFLRCFGLSSLDDLPQINPVQTEEFRIQAEKEIGLPLEV
jgi:segregation and condensation protein B